MKFDIRVFFSIFSRNLCLNNIWHITATLHESQYSFLIISRWFLLRIRDVLRPIFFFRKSCHFDIKWKNTVEYGRSQMTLWRMWSDCGIIDGYKHKLRSCSTRCCSTARMAGSSSVLCVSYLHCSKCACTDKPLKAFYQRNVSFIDLGCTQKTGCCRN